MKRCVSALLAGLPLTTAAGCLLPETPLVPSALVLQLELTGLAADPLA